MRNQKSTQIIVLGIAVFVVAAALLFVVLRNDNKSSKAPAAGTATTTTTVAPGTRTFTNTPATSPTEFKIAAGQNGLAIQMAYFGGGGGYVRSGDLVNIYVIVNKNCTDARNPLGVKLVLSNVKVLSVLGSAPAATGQPGSFLLALTPAQVEEVIFFQTEDQLYFSLTNDSEPTANTTGFNCSSAL